MAQENSNSILIRGGTVWDPSLRKSEIRDLFLSEGKIQDTPPKNPKTVEAKGLWVLPGFVDPHVHLREPGGELKETIRSGAWAAVTGGFTTVACMANTHPVNDRPEVTAFIIKQAEKADFCRVLPIGALSQELKGERLANFSAMKEQGIVAISDDGIPVKNSALMRAALELSSYYNLPVISHAEDAYLCEAGMMNEGMHALRCGLHGIPNESEEIMVARDIALARLTQSKLHFAHLSTKQAIAHLKRAKEEGLLITAEVTPHHLLLIDENVGNYDTHFKMAPPLRSRQDCEVLISALASGLIDCIASDHAPHTPEEKEKAFAESPNGVIGLETSAVATFSLVKKGLLTEMRWIEALTWAPSKILNLPYGTLRPGQSADVVLFDPNGKTHVTRNYIQSKSQNTPFLDQIFPGKILKTWVSGELKYESKL